MFLWLRSHPRGPRGRLVLLHVGWGRLGFVLRLWGDKHLHRRLLILGLR